MLALTIAWKVPLIRSATKVGKAIALSVSRVMRPTWLAARASKCSCFTGGGASFIASTAASAVAGCGSGCATGTVSRWCSTGVWPSRLVCAHSSCTRAAV